MRHPWLIRLIPLLAMAGGVHIEAADAAGPLDDLSGWSVELEAGGSVTVEGGVMEIDVPRGATVWYREELRAPVTIEYRAMAVDEGGENDRVSDLNCFWMARDTRNPDDLFAVKRSGNFRDYDRLRTYYVGLGGNNNTTTRFRRYVGVEGDRPLRPEHDLSGEGVLLRPDEWQDIRIEVHGDGRTRYLRDGEVLFDYVDDEPYTRGYFAFRTVKNHLRIEGFRVTPGEPGEPGARRAGGSGGPG